MFTCVNGQLYCICYNEKHANAKEAPKNKTNKPDHVHYAFEAFQPPLAVLNFSHAIDYFKGFHQSVRICFRGFDIVEDNLKRGWKGIMGHAIQKYSESRGFSVVREYCGHGIGKVFHEDPQVLHYGRPGIGEVLVPGMVFTIEPMINVGRRETRLLGDGWTVHTKDRSLSAQWEHTLAVTEKGFDVLTQLPGDEL